MIGPVPSSTGWRSAARASALYPLDKPPLPFRPGRGACGHLSPLGLNIHPVYGLWHAFRAALLFDQDPGLPAIAAAPSPCDSCIGNLPDRLPVGPCARWL